MSSSTVNDGASTSTGSSSSAATPFRVKVPRSQQENRQLKAGFVDDNNEELSYFRFSLLWPAAVAAVFSVTLFIVAIVGSLYTDYIPTEMELKRSFLAKYGTSRFICNVSSPTA
ncbi:unnamed protein product [Nippostrongylus brasiliensis]|uniref:Transmembrane protein n=1 Tax=Nippostrongylus brasiliensis TaxID=27835 RepID=A0A0N4YNU2_NIPBR|nr:unnamed protein product [Nippostrongylus brasiliensis]